jgi:hypothetical protein
MLEIHLWTNAARYFWFSAMKTGHHVDAATSTESRVQVILISSISASTRLLPDKRVRRRHRGVAKRLGRHVRLSRSCRTPAAIRPSCQLM